MSNELTTAGTVVVRTGEGAVAQVTQSQMPQMAHVSSVAQGALVALVAQSLVAQAQSQVTQMSLSSQCLFMWRARWSEREKER